MGHTLGRTPPNPATPFSCSRDWPATLAIMALHGLAGAMCACMRCAWTLIRPYMSGKNSFAEDAAAGFVPHPVLTAPSGKACAS
jgi:hypothetical protein